LFLWTRSAGSAGEGSRSPPPPLAHPSHSVSPRFYFSAQLFLLLVKIETFRGWLPSRKNSRRARSLFLKREFFAFFGPTQRAHCFYSSCMFTVHTNKKKLGYFPHIYHKKISKE
jgi:hypothetical protein